MKEMKLFGIGVSEGIATAPMYRMKSKNYNDALSAAGDPEAEKARFYISLKNVQKNLAVMAENARKTIGEDAASLFEMHAELCEDPDFTDYVIEAIDNGASAENAVHTAGENFATIFESMEDSYIRERAQDIRDISSQIYDNLSDSATWQEPDVPYILVAEDLTPSQTISLKRENLRGILLEKGTQNGHTAILARLMGIGAVIGLGEKLSDIEDGTMLAIDGDDGIVIVSPSNKTQQEYRLKEEKNKTLRKKYESVRGLPDETNSGKKLHIRCSIGSPDDMQSVLNNDGHGIGLFRSEFLYLGRSSFPTEEEQFACYRSVLSAAKNECVTIRTADIGADKPLSYWKLEKEENSALGQRGVRLSLNYQEIFRTQLRALYRASIYGKLQILLPMVSNVWEVSEVRKICGKVVEELKAEGVKVAENVPIGVMIETPAAALIAEKLAEVSDFFSIGTNDLTQYTLACDRQNGNISKHCPKNHDAVLKLIKITADSAHKAGIPVAICGELGTDETLLQKFVEMGIDEISVPPAKVLPLRAELRSLL